jgi:hypothetical protein
MHNSQYGHISAMDQFDDDTIKCIVRFLHAKDVIALLMVCKRFYALKRYALIRLFTYQVSPNAPIHKDHD